MKKCLLIEVSEDGSVAMGTAEKDDSMPPEGYEMQPVESVEAALEQAKGMLGGSQPGQDPGNQDEANGAAFEQGYKGVSGMEGLQ